MVFRVASGGGSSGLVIGAGATPITGGTASRVLFEGATNVLSESADFTFAATTGVLTIGGTTAGAGIVVTGGTITADSQRISITETRNNAGVTFGGAIKVVITDTASAAGSLAMQILGGSTGTHVGLQLSKLGVLTGRGMGSLNLYGLLLGGDPASQDTYTIRITAVGNAYFLSSGSAITGYWSGVDGASAWRVDSKGSFSWSQTQNDATDTLIANISMISSGLLAVGTGAQGSSAGRLKLTSTITAAVAVGSLNASPTIGEVQTVNDALAIAAKGAIVAAGGTAVCQVMWNGANWVGT